MNQKKVGVILSYASQFVQIITGLLYTPIMLRLLGKSEYGLYQLVYSVVSYLSLLSLGFGSSYMRFYSREKAKGDEDGVARINGMFLLIFLFISFICILCGLFMIGNIKMIFGRSLTASEYRTAKILMTLMIMNLALTFPNSLFTGIITSQEKFIFQKSLILAQNLLSPFLSLPLLLSGFGSIGIVSVSTALTLIVLFSNIFYCKVIIRSRFLFKCLRISLLKEMWAFTFFIFLNQIVDQINWSVDKYLLGRISGTLAVAVYGIGAQINTLYVQFSSSVSSVFIPRVNRIVAESGDNHSLTVLLTKVGRIQFMIMTLILSGFIFFGKSFIGFWAGNGYQESYYVAILLIVPVTVPLIQNLGIEIQRAKNKHKARSIAYFFIAIANVFISIPLIHYFGPIGAALGTCISITAGNIIFMNWYYHNKLGLNMKYFWLNIARIIPAISLPVVLGCISMTINYSSLFALGLGIILYTIIFCISMYFLGMNDEERTLIDAPFRKVWSR